MRKTAILSPLDASFGVEDVKTYKNIYKKNVLETEKLCV